MATREMGRCLRCGGSGQHWHHRRGRAVRDQHTHCACNGVLLCRTCHEWAHANPFEARRTGFIVSRSEPEPRTVQVEAFYGALFLTCEGMVEFAEQGA